LKAYHKITILLIVLLFYFQQNNTAQDSLSVKKQEKHKFIAEPQRATMLAITFPGLGQVYNRKYWKVPVVYAGFGGLAYAISYNSSWYTKYMKAFQDYTDDIPETDSYKELLYLYDPEDYEPLIANQNAIAHWKERMIAGIDSYKKYRDLSYIGIAVWYLVTVLDANVDASLYNYDIGDNLDIEVTPVKLPLSGAGVGLNVSMIVTF
jgi:hypothetical protein